MTDLQDTSERPGGSDPRVADLKPAAEKGQWKDTWIAVVLVASALLTTFWIVANRASHRPWGAYEYTPRHFFDFVPSFPGREVRRLTVPQEPEELNLFVFDVRLSDGEKVRARLLHGYNMVDCMRIKGYQVDELPDYSRGVGRQAWRLTSSEGEVSVWITGVLKAGSLEHSGMDVRHFAFPRVGIPDDTSWMPVGLTWSSLRHPIRNFRTFLRARWNAARCDWLTFLRLRRPAWADDERFTYVVSWSGPTVSSEREPAVAASVSGIYECIYRQLQAWRKAGL